jgi:hypothetical protein
MRQTAVVEKIRTFNNYFETRAFYEIMWSRKIWYRQIDRGRQG